jgi:hypothetical protein
MARPNLMMWLAMAAATLIALLAFTLVAGFGPDPHHDGFQFGVAVAVSDHLAVFRGVFQQYGPLTAWLHGGSLQVFGARLIVLRIETAVLLAVGAGLLVYLVKRHTGSVLFGVVLSIAWVCACPVWAVYRGTHPLWPWPSVVLMVLMLVALISYELGRTRSAGWMLVAGAASCAAIFTRWPSGIAMSVALVTCLVVFERHNHRLLPLGWRFLAGFLVIAVGLGGVLVFQRSLQDGIYQSVFYPFTAYSGVGTGLAFWKLYYGYGSLAIAAIVGAAAVVCRVRSGVLKATAIIIGLLVAGIVVRVGVGFPPAQEARLLGLPESLVGAADIQGDGVLVFATVMTPIVALLVLISSRGHLMRIRDAAPLGAVALTAFLQLYPIADVYHLWWAMPIPIAYVGTMLYRRSRLMPRRTLLVGTLALAPFMLLGVYGYSKVISTDRVQIDHGVLTGMSVLPEQVASVRELDRLLLSGPGAQARQFVCRDGLIAVYAGSYRPNSPRFVDWAWLRPESDPPVAASPYTVLCAPDPATIASMAAAWNMRVIRQSQQPISLSAFSSFYLAVLEPMPVAPVGDSN